MEILFMSYPHVIEKVIRPNNKKYYEDESEIWFRVKDTEEEKGIGFTGSDDNFITTLERLERFRLKYNRKFWIKKIVWKTPLYSIGYVQWSPRPFMQGMGCDGTTDGCIHLLGKIYCEKLGHDYIDLYRAAHSSPDCDASWIKDLERFSKETVIPKTIDPRLLLEDLYQINNRSLCELLSKLFDIEYS
jgi:hypothetical protein